MSIDSGLRERLRLGLAAPVFAAPGIVGLRTPSLEQASWNVVRDAVRTAEALGYDSAWFSDHLFLGRDGAFFESWTAMSVAAGFTDRIRLVNNHLGVGLRDPRVLGKMATSLAAISGGRVDLFLGRGYRESEYRAYGQLWPTDEVRTDRLAEAIDVIGALWPGEPVDFAGEFWSLRDAVAKPTDAPPLVWVGGPLDAETLAVIASRAGGWNSFPLGLGDYRAAAEQVDGACAAIGRDPATVRRSLETQVLVLESDDELDDWIDRWARLREALHGGGHTADEMPPAGAFARESLQRLCRDQFIVGTRDHVVSRIREYRDAGVTDLVCWFMDAPGTGSMTVLAELRSRWEVP
ncbi:LLM class flavin-dependent oxidoreductase [Microbacterium pygmaeum]|uniref:Flavin-dependent oxidoreductase, luciferase family (Includes alkanesulfonate monooxygenase SsuD and methylene tetrahydromethanopterin reductase) n=1 Tax=Microbacterium pygmaeum TaxID=370764 RepID=A0A1G7YM13_9MICO|nr:LLM class flavin-dependent oxidoreductase [Microbacterium pygmaeum]SDG97592.1 Flavin-dependent oxidoreductase, luciferase family (includes alkanesulfonate monooxygenase SsuD and methylene tetrahydromethanopterin reductase) [Microbacterium pygmaeum]